MPAKKPKNIVTPILTLMVVGFVALTAVAGFVAYIYAYNENITAVWWQNMVLGVGLVAILSLVGTAVVLREMRETMNKERQANERVYKILEASPLLIEIWDAQLNVIDCNQRMLDTVGLDSKEEYIRRYYEFTPKLQACGTPSTELAAVYVWEALEQGSAQFEWLYLLPDGSTMPVESTCVRIDIAGEPIIVCHNHDLRPIRALLEKERSAQEFTAKLLNASPMSCFLLDQDRNAIYCNQAATELFVHRPGQPIYETYPEHGAFSKCTHNCENCPFGECIAHAYLVARYRQTFPGYAQNEAHIERSIADCCRTALADGMCRFEFSCLTLYGKKFPCEVTIVPVRHQKDHGFAVYLRDLSETELMLAEAERRQLAEQENRAKTRFLARMSHEIRTPMNVVMGTAEIMLKKGKHPPETQMAFTRIQSSSNMLLGIINDILDLSRIEAGKMDVVPEPYDVAGFISDVVQLHLLLIDNDEIDFALRVDPALPTCLIGDELRLKQILGNLLSNAFKYTQRGRVVLALEAQHDEQADAIILVARVSDTGQGMTPEQLENLFSDEFTRFNMQSNRAIEGSGLGLSIAYSLVNMMGGTVAAQSRSGEGSTFTVRLPQKREGRETLGKKSAESLERLEMEHRTQKVADDHSPEPMPYGRVLVVDDVESNLYVVEGILEPYGMTVEMVESGEAAIGKIESGSVYDIIFMDHMMPGMDGIETAKVLRSMGYTHPIVALTANAFKDSAEMFLQSGFADFISKPIDIAQMDACLMRFVRDKQPPEVIASAHSGE